MNKLTIGRRHDTERWELIFAPDIPHRTQQKFFNEARSRRKHRVYREIWMFGENGPLKKKLGRDWTRGDIDSSSSNSSSSSSSSSSTEASESSSSSVNSSSSQSSSSSSSSINSSSSSSS